MGLPRELHDYHLHTRFSDGIATPWTMVEHCAKHGCHDIAFTDHVDEYLQFMFAPSYSETKSFHDYLNELESAKQRALEEYRLKLHVGIELMEDAKSFDLTFFPAIGPYLGEIEIILVDGTFLDNPIRTAKILREFLDDEGENTTFVGISHPRYSQIGNNDLEMLASMGIFLELNETKFTREDANALKNMLRIVDIHAFTPPRFSLGSDAHAPANAGIVDIVYGRAEQFHLLENLIKL